MSKSKAFDVQPEVRTPWRSFLDHLEPIRPELHRYCMSITGNVWDGEDLLQDALVRVFSLLGKHDNALENPRAYLIRTATNLWIDRARRLAVEQAALALQIDDSTALSPEIAVDGRDAAKRLFSQLSAKERAAVIMKDVLGLTADEAASILQTSSSAVKSALNRGRQRLKNKKPSLRLGSPSRETVDAFVTALRDVDIEALRSICSDDMATDLVGGVEMASFDQAKPVFEHAHMVWPDLGFGDHPWWEVIEFEGENMVAGYRTLNGVEGLNEIHRMEVADGKIVRLRIYCFCPDTLRVVADRMGKPIVERPITPYRSPSSQ